MGFQAPGENKVQRVQGSFLARLNTILSLVNIATVGFIGVMTSSAIAER
jgi:hypothetical protein